MTVIATGGLARMIAEESSTIDKTDHFLTLTGLRVLYERNAASRKGYLERLKISLQIIYENRKFRNNYSRIFGTYGWCN